jgi:hypothetical protein
LTCWSGKTGARDGTKTKKMKLILSLSEKTPDFIEGMEVGRIYERMSKKEDPVTNDGFPIHICNKDVVMRLCKALGYVPLFGEEHFGEWIEFMGIRSVTGNN